MPQAPHIIAVNISAGGIPKRPVDAAVVSVQGLEGDGHDHEKHNTPMQAVSLIDAEDLDDLRADGFSVHPGATGENVTVRSLSVDDLAVGDVLRFSGGVEIELTRKRNPCYVLDAISPDLKTAVAGRLGFYARVITPGTLRPGETIETEHKARSTTHTPHDSA